MAFKKPLEQMVLATRGAVGAVFVDSEGETIDAYTAGDAFEIRLAGAHQGIILQMIQKATDRIRPGNGLEGLSIRSEKYCFTIAPVQEGTFLVLVQNEWGLPSEGLQALKRTIPQIRGLI